MPALVSSRRFAALLASVAVVSGVVACGEATEADRSFSGSKPSLPPSASGSIVARAALGSPESTVWIDRTSEIPARISPGIADQPNRSRVIVYGGWNIDSGVRSDTWEWDGVGWIRRVPEADPGPRFSPAAVFDEVAQRVLLFGGITTFTPEPSGADRITWEWNGVDWAPIFTEHSPTARAASAFTWDAPNRRALLFGGFVQDEVERNTALGDDAFWFFDGHDWAEIPKSGEWPTARGLGSMSRDPRTGNFVMHGGFNQIKIVNGNLDFADTLYINDTWEWNGTTWRKLPGAIEDIGIGAPRVTVDPIANELIMFVDSFNSSILYALVDGQWVPRQNRGKERLFSVSSWSTANQALLVTGGSSRAPSGLPSATASNGDFLVSVGTPFRKIADPIRVRPRITSAAAVVRATGDTVLFGGRDDTTSYLAGTIVWDGGRWRSPLQADPPELRARIRHAMAPLGSDHVLLFGGSAGGPDLLGDTWLWDSKTETWTLDERAGGPTARINATMTAFGDSVLLYGGDAGSSNLFGDTWTYRQATGWVRATPPASPPARTFAMATPGVGEPPSVLLYGGMEGNENTTVGTMYRYDGSTWTLVADYRPYVRRRGGMATDQRFGRVFAMGGTGSSSQTDLWDLTEPVGRQSTPVLLEDNQELPLRRHDAIFVESPRTGGAFLFGGQSNDSDRDLADSWQLEVFGATCTQSSECGVGQSCTEGVCCESSNCGPCRTCAGPNRPGLCTARGTFGPEPGCDAPGQACNVLGQCRLDNEQPCSEDLACASTTCLQAGREKGICCNAEGCTLRCVEGGLRGPDGTTTSCAPYGCAVDRCNASCTSIDECAPGFECTDKGACVPAGSAGGDGDGGCSCHAAGGPTTRPLGISALVALGLFGLRARSRRETKRPAPPRRDRARR